MSDTNYTNLGFVEETVFGTTPATALQLLRITGSSLSPKRSVTRSGEIRSDLRAGQPVRTLEWWEGDVNFEASYDTFDSILEGMAMEDFDSTVLVDGTTKKSYTFEDQIIDPEISPFQYMVYKGGRLGGLNLSLAVESIVTGSFSLMGKVASIAQATAGTGTATIPTSTTPLNCVDMVTSIAEGASGGGTTALTKVVGVDLQFERALRRKTEIGNINPFDIGVGRLMITGTLQQHFENDRLADAFFAFTDRVLNLEFTDDDGNEMLWEFPKIKLTTLDISKPGPDDDVMGSFDFEVYADAADPALFRITKTDG